MRLVCLEAISVIKDPLKSPLQLLQLFVGFEFIELLHLMALFFSFVTSLNDDVCEPFALIKILTNCVAVRAWKTLN